MAKKNAKESATPQKTLNLETVVVGAGLSGQLAARRLQRAYPQLQVMIVEAEDRPGGRINTGLRLVPSEWAHADLQFGKEFLPGRVRWDKNWVPYDQVDWVSKEWLQVLPQWEKILTGTHKTLVGLQDSDYGVAVKTLAPVNKIQALSDAHAEGWVLETPEQTVMAKRVIWAAGLKAFQNAFGKAESQAFCVANPAYSRMAADYRGGLVLELTFKEAPEFEDLAPLDHIWGLPVRHEGKLSLMLAVVEGLAGKAITMRTMVHLHQDMLAEPKEILSFQKSVKRTIKNILKKDVAWTERWIVNSRVQSHALGTPWLLGSGFAGSLEFIGDESAAGSLRFDSFEGAAAAASTAVVTVLDGPLDDNRIHEVSAY